MTLRHEGACGVDAGTGYAHAITGMAANEHDSQHAHKLTRENDEVMYGDSGYLGVENQEVVRQEPHLWQVECRINKRPTSIMKMGDGINWERSMEQKESSVGSKMEHIFFIDKKYFGYSKASYRGFAKNMNGSNILFARTNLLMGTHAEQSFALIERA